MPRFQADALTIDQLTANLKVLADFRTEEIGSSNLTIREGIFKKTSGKINLFKMVVRDAEDSLTNQHVLDEILKNLGHYTKNYRDTNKTDDCLDILLNGMYGFLKLGSKYRDRTNVDNIANAMSEVSKMAERLFYERLDWFKIYKKTTYNQNTFNVSNKVHLGGTCWAMVADWARRFVLKGKMGYEHGLNPLLPFIENKLKHRGKYIAHIQNLNQGLDFQNMGAAIGNMAANKNRGVTPETLASTNDLVAKYRAEQKGSKRTIEEKFDKLAYARVGNLDLGYICLGNKIKKRNRRLDFINNLVTIIANWINSDSIRYTTNNLFAVHGIGFLMQEDVGFTNWNINQNRQQNANMNINQQIPNMQIFGIINNRIQTYHGGHKVAFGYNPDTKKCYFMDPNFGDWELPCDPQIVASLIYWVLKVYTVIKEKNAQNPRYFCAMINNIEHSLFSTTP